MKILEVNKFNYLRRGAEKHYLDVVALLKARGHEVAVFSMEHPQNNFSPWKKYFMSYAGFSPADSWWAKLKGLSRIYSLEAKRKMGKLLADFQPDIVHLHNIYHHISPSILSEIKRRKIPIVMTIHDYNLVCPDYSLRCNGLDWFSLAAKPLDFIRKKGFKNSRRQSFLALLEFQFNRYFGFYEQIDLFIAPSEFVKNILIKGGIPHHKIEVIPHFTLTEDMFTACHYPREKNSQADERYAFYYGSISKEKNVDLLVEIFQDLPKTRLYLAGPMEKNFILPKNWKINYLGNLKRQELTQYIRGSLFAVSASMLPETFGLIALEALQNGKPFIGFKSGAFPEIIDNDRNGYLCETAGELREKIKLLAADDGLRILFSRNALEKARVFSEERYYQKIQAIFDRLLTKRPDGSIITS